VSTAIKTLSAFFIVAVVLGPMSLVAYANNNDEWPLGVEIAATFDELLSDHQTAIQEFIDDVRRLTSETQADRLALIEGKQDELRAKIEEVNATREALIADLQDGTITVEAFAAEMRKLATDLAEVAKSMGSLGEALSDLNKELAGDLKELAEALVAVNQQLAEDMAEVGKAIADELKNRELPVPENLPSRGGS